jgi:Protein of unknown function (DUF2924)
VEQIEVDFEVYKQLTIRRATERVTYNEVVRELLGMKPRPSSQEVQAGHSAADWVVKGVRFPVGTEFRAEYKGQHFAGTVREGSLVFKGERFATPSAAAMAITDSPVNGWVFWECRLPGQSSWNSIKSLRRK